jgi:L-serine dehydratase
MKPAFLMRNALVGPMAVITGRSPSAQQDLSAPPPPTEPPGNVSAALEVVKQSRRPVMTTLEEFYKVDIVEAWTAS